MSFGSLLTDAIHSLRNLLVFGYDSKFVILKQKTPQEGKMKRKLKQVPKHRPLICNYLPMQKRMKRNNNVISVISETIWCSELFPTVKIKFGNPCRYLQGERKEYVHLSTHRHTQSRIQKYGLGIWQRKAEDQSMYKGFILFQLKVLKQF